MVGRTRVRARRERCLSRAPDRSNLLPSPAFVSYLRRLLGRQSSSPEGKRKGSRDPGGALESCVGGRTAAAVTARGWRGRRYPILPYLPACRPTVGFPKSRSKSVPSGGSSLAKLRSLRQSILRRDSWLLFLPLSHGFVASGFFAKGSAFR